MTFKQLRHRAVIGAMVAGVVLGGMATAASAKPINTDQNQESYWEGLGYGECSKVEDPADPFVVPAPDEGNAWTLLVIKAGSAQSVETVNDLIEDPQEGDSYTHSSGKGISHIILCQDGDDTSYPPS
jgi:hypothetical protein